MDILTAIYLSLVVIVGSFLQVNVGLGLGVLCMMFFPMMFKFSTAVAMNVIIASASAFYIMLKYWKDIKWGSMIPVTIVSLGISTITTLYSLQVQQQNLEIVLGCVLMLLSLYFVWFADSIRIRPTVSIGLLMGAVAGVGNGLFGLGGPPVALYLMASIQEKKSYVASIQTYFFFSNLVAMIVRTLTGAIEVTHVPYIIIGWLGTATGTFFGIKAFNKLSTPMVKRLVYAFVGLSGAITVFRAL